MADTSGKKPSASRNGSTQKNTQKRTTQRSNTRNYSTDNRRSNSKKRNVSKQDSALYSEIGLIVLLVFMLFLFFCNLGLIGPFSNTIRGVLFGLFGALRNVGGRHAIEMLETLKEGGEYIPQGWLWIKNVWQADNFFNMQEMMQALGGYEMD